MTTRFFFPLLSVVIFTGQVSAQQTRPREDRSREIERTPRVFSFSSSDDDEKRPRIGIATGTGGKRDTLGLLVTDVTRGGPADKAGIEDGDRLQSVNGVNLRLSVADVDDEETMGLATRRLIRELGKVDVGAESVVVTIDKRAHNPYLVASGLHQTPTPMPWFGNKKLTIRFA